MIHGGQNSFWGGQMDLKCNFTILSPVFKGCVRKQKDRAFIL
jgi:hypothetical protein